MQVNDLGISDNCMGRQDKLLPAKPAEHRRSWLKSPRVSPAASLVPRFAEKRHLRIDWMAAFPPIEEARRARAKRGDFSVVTRLLLCGFQRLD
jgi:hypothetical protein